LIFVCIAALNKIGIETTSFVALIGAAGLAIGLALQGSLANFAAGVMLIFLQPFKIGDEVEAGGASGFVREIQIFSTIMETRDKKKVIVPNAKITSDKIVVLP
jgi:small conductance mechanosensitive channel